MSRKSAGGGGSLGYCDVKLFAELAKLSALPPSPRPARQQLPPAAQPEGLRLSSGATSGQVAQLRHQPY